MINFLRRNDLTTDWVRWAVGALLVAGLFCPYLTSSTATAAPAPATKAPAVAKTTPIGVTNTLRALDKLRSFGYSIDTPARAAKAIRHWQKVNGLVVDGIVGSETLGSLNLSAQPTVPAVRLNPPAPAPEPVVGNDPASTEQIIREVWPDNIEDWAVRIAKRESGPNLKVDAANYCCYGIFQIYYSVHRAWLADYGVNQPSDLFDPRVNATVALALYGQVGCRPW